MQNGTQVALFQRESESWFEHHAYEVFYTDAVEPTMLMAFLVYIDQIYFDSPGGLAVWRIEKTYPMHDLFPERALWSPKENSEEEKN